MPNKGQRVGPHLPGSPRQSEDPDLDEFQEYEMEIEVQCPECGRWLGLFNGLCREKKRVFDPDSRQFVTITTDYIRCPNCDELTTYDEIEG